MKKLNEMVKEETEWGDAVQVVALSVDKTPQLAADHAKQRGWNSVDHFWSRPFDDAQCYAERAFVVRGVPTAILLNRDGTIAWRGHPEAAEDGIELHDRIEAMIVKE